MARRKKSEAVDPVERGGRRSRVRVEVEPPRRARCGRCGGERLRVAYTSVYREHGVRRVTADCQDCGAVCWWDEVLGAGDVNDV